MKDPATMSQKERETLELRAALRHEVVTALVVADAPDQIVIVNTKVIETPRLTAFGVLLKDQMTDEYEWCTGTSRAEVVEMVPQKVACLLVKRPQR